MLYVGIDPGERWCGFAALEITSDDVVRVEARTYDVTKHGGYLFMARDLIDLLPHARRAQIVIEDFRIRGSGHQRFNHGDTLRFLGALEFGVQSVDLFEQFLIPPNDRGSQESRKLFGPVLDRYRRRWPNPRHERWNHCLSAWRVLGYHLLKHEESALAELHAIKRKSYPSEQWLPTCSKLNDLIAPAAIWSGK
jgi:hypothetical protein